MDRYYFYIDFEDTNGYVRIAEYDLALSLIKRRDLNDLILRDYLEGVFKISGSQSTLAQTAFITNSKFKLPMRIYEWGISGVGTLIWQGYAIIKSKFDFNRNYVELTKFETTDIYSPLLAILEKSIYWNGIFSTTGADIMTNPVCKGVNSNCNKIQTLNWDGTDFTTAGTPLSLPIVGRPAIGGPQTGGDVAIFEAIAGSLTRYNTADTGLTYTASTLGTKTYITDADRSRSGALCYYNNTAFLYVDDYNNQIRKYTQATGSWTLSYYIDVPELKHPELVLLYIGSPNYFALINEKDGTIRRIYDNGSSFLVQTDYPIGEIINPKAALLTTSSTEPEIVMVDAKTQLLRTMKYTASDGWKQLGSSISIGNVKAPCLAKLDTNIYAVYDNNTGVLQAYTWASSAWTATGNALTYTGGYYAAMLGITTNRIILVSSDSFKLDTEINWATPGLINGILDAFNVYSNDKIGMSETDHGANFDPNKVYWGDLSVVKDLRELDEAALTKINLKQILDLIEQMFQNYWYLIYDVEGSAIDYQIKFATPDEFSTFGSDVDVSALTDDLNIREYLDQILTDRETMTFNNAKNSDFRGEDIEYARDTDIQIDTAIAITTDWEAVFDAINGDNANFQKSGLFALYGDYDSDVNNQFVIDNDTGPTSITNVRNEQLSKARLQNDFMKDYRFANVGNVNINGTNYAVQNTCRKIIDFPDVEKVLATYPGQLAQLSWGSGIKSYIYEAETVLKSGKTIFRSTLLEI